MLFTWATWHSSCKHLSVGDFNAFRTGNRFLLGKFLFESVFFPLKIYRTISRSTCPILGLFVLILKYFILNSNMPTELWISKFLKKFKKGLSSSLEIRLKRVSAVHLGHLVQLLQTLISVIFTSSLTYNCDSISYQRTKLQKVALNINHPMILKHWNNESQIVFQRKWASHLREIIANAAVYPPNWATLKSLAVDKKSQFTAVWCSEVLATLILISKCFSNSTKKQKQKQKQKQKTKKRTSKLFTTF